MKGARLSPLATRRGEARRHRLSDARRGEIRMARKGEAMRKKLRSPLFFATLPRDSPLRFSLQEACWCPTFCSLCYNQGIFNTTQDYASPFDGEAMMIASCTPSDAASEPLSSMDARSSGYCCFSGNR